MYGDRLCSVMASILSVVEIPNCGDTVLDSSNVEYFAFIPYIEGVEAICREAMIGSIAHSVVLLKLPDGSDVESVAKSIKDNANPRKWICVEAEKTIVSTSGNMVILIMSNADTAEAINKNFLAY